MEQQKSETFSTPPWAITTGTVEESSAYTKASTEATAFSESATITFVSEEATITFASTTSTATNLVVYNGTSAPEPSAFTSGQAAGRVAVGGAGVMGGIVAVMALL